MSKIARVYLAIFISTLFWGFSFIWTKTVLNYVEPLTTVLFRLLISTFLLYFLSSMFNKLQKIEKGDWKTIFLLALFQPFLYFIGENVGLTYASATATSVIIATIPLFSPIASYFFLKEKVTLMNMFGILISIFGVFMVILKPDFTIAIKPVGIALLMLAVFSAIAYSVVVVKLSSKYNVYTLVTYQNAVGVLFFLPIVFIFEYHEFMALTFSWEYVIPLLELAVFASSVAFMLFTFGIQNLGVVRTNSLANLIPVFTAIFAYFLLDERLSFINSIGISIVISGLFLSQIRTSRFQFLKRNREKLNEEVADEINSVR